MIFARGHRTALMTRFHEKLRQHLHCGRAEARQGRRYDTGVRFRLCNANLAAAEKMAQLGVTTSDISAALKDQNVQAPVGGVGQSPSENKQEFQYTARVKGRMETAEEFGQIIIRSQSDGSLVRIKDVARTEMGDKDYLFASFSDGMPSVGFSIQLSPTRTLSTRFVRVQRFSRRLPNLSLQHEIRYGRR